MEYPINLYIESISVIGNLAGSILILKLLFGEGQELGGWDWARSLIVLGFYTLLEGFTISLLQPNMKRIVNQIQDGTFDFVLLKPIDSQFILSLRIFSPWGIPSVICGVSLIIFGLSMINWSLSLLLISYTIILFLCSLIILYSIWFIVSTFSIWFIRVWNANEVLRSVLVSGRYPISSYPPVLRTILTFVLPVAFLTTFPAEAILGQISYKILILAVIFSVLSFFASRIFWKFALRFYTSASS